MGYTTEFYGKFTLDKPLTEAQAAYLDAFSNTRHMRRNPAVTNTLSDPVREAVGLPVGPEGRNYVGSSLEGVLDHNDPPVGQPGLWCHWAPTLNCDGIPLLDCDTISWTGAEKFYDYQEWLEYIITYFLKPWGYVLNGTVEWEGEDSNDRGLLIVTDNILTTKIGRVVYE